MAIRVVNRMISIDGKVGGPADSELADSEEGQLGIYRLGVTGAESTDSESEREHELRPPPARARAGPSALRAGRRVGSESQIPLMDAAASFCAGGRQSRLPLSSPGRPGHPSFQGSLGLILTKRQMQLSSPGRPGPRGSARRRNSENMATGLRRRRKTVTWCGGGAEYWSRSSSLQTTSSTSTTSVSLPCSVGRSRTAL